LSWVWHGLIIAGLAAVLAGAWRYTRRHPEAGPAEQEAVVVVEVENVTATDPAVWPRMAHLARDFDALAAQIEREPLAGMRPWQDPRTLRWCASQLRDRLGITE
jgi:hypothetical protein